MLKTMVSPVNQNKTPLNIAILRALIFRDLYELKNRGLADLHLSPHVARVFLLLSLSRLRSNFTMAIASVA